MNCAHCGRPGIGDELYCSACGLAFIPERPVAIESGPPDRVAAAPAALPQLAPSVATAGSPGTGWAVAAHVTAVLGALVGGVTAFAGPLVILLSRSEDPFTAEHARQSLNFNLSVLLYAVVGGVTGAVLTVLTLGLALLVLIPLLALAVVGYGVVSLVGAIAAAQGRPFRYPLALPLVRL